MVRFSALWGKPLAGKPGVMLQAVLVFLFFAASSVWLGSVTREKILQGAGERFVFTVAEIQFATRQRLLAYEQVLRGGTALFASQAEVSRDQWRHYVRTLDVDKNYPGIQGIGFSQYVLPQQMPAHLRRIRAAISPDYAIRPDGARAEYTAIIYLEPFDWRNQRAFGYDMFSEPVRRAAMAHARDSGAPAVSGKVTLVQETGQAVQQGFLMYLPVFQNGAPVQTLAQRRAALSGYVYAPFRMNDLIQGILGSGQQPRTRLEIFDGAATTAQSLMYDSLTGALGANPAPAAFTTERAFEFNGHRWTLRLSSLPAFDATIDQQKPQMVLFGGLLVSALFAGIVWSSGQSRRRARQIASANQALEQLATDLSRAKNAAEAANQAKGEFLANVSHELRTPLTLILAPLAQLSAAHTAPTDWRLQVERMTRHALLLLNRVNDILDVSKADAGKFDLHWESVDLAALIGPLMDDAVAVASSKGRRLTWSVDAALGQVVVDWRHLEKILLNLVGNALKFTPEGGWIRLSVLPLDAQRYELSVADSGVGIATDKLADLFQRFHQIDTSATRQYSGSGLGLALVKQLVELMGGEVGVESEAGRGARFFIRLPRAHGTDKSAPASQETAVKNPDTLPAALRRARFEESSAASGAGSPVVAPPDDAERPRVLVADDHADMRQYLAGLLAQDCAVSTAADGLAAWALLQRQPFDAVVSDVMMPGLDGHALTARIKADPVLARLPVILVTARGGAEASTAGLACGADDYIAKPFSPGELRARVHAALRMGKMQAQLRDASRQAGVAMLASGILHNVGNMLCNVTVSAAVMQDILRQSDIGRLAQVAGLLRPPGPAVDRTMPPDLAVFVEQLAQRLRLEHEKLAVEVSNLRDCAAHAAGIIASQQDVAAAAKDVAELVAVRDLLDTALALSKNRTDGLGVVIERDETAHAAVRVDRYKVLQILVNLIANAVDAMESVPAATRRLMLRARQAGPQLQIEIQDTGTGIDARHGPLLFGQGFTTKGAGHGYGLHLSAIWAREAGGALRCHSDGAGRGATFTLMLPCPAGAGATAAQTITEETA